MIWLYLSLGCAFFTAATDAISKRALKESDEYIVAWLRLVLAAPVLLAALLIFGEIPPLERSFFLTVAGMLPLELTALILYLKAIKISPLSLTVPFLAFTPLFLIGSGLLILGETPRAGGLIGILLVTGGAYVLQAHKAKGDLLGPIKAIMRERGSRYMLIVAFLYSVTSALGKLAILRSNPLFFSFFYFSVIAVLLTPVALMRSGGISRLGLNRRRLTLYLALGLVFAAATLLHVTAVRLIDIAYFISVKRLSLVFGVLFGGLWFHETHLKERLLGSLIMVAGVVALALL